MQYARMKVSKTIFDAKEKCVPLSGNNGTVYAPKSKFRDIKIVYVGAAVPHVSFLCPCWVFWKNDMKPYQMDDFVEQIEVKEAKGE